MSNPADPIRFSVPTRPAGDKKKKLGKGLGALMGETRREEPLVQQVPGDGTAADNNAGRVRSDAGPADAPQTGLASIPVANIEPLPGQPRTYFDDEALDELAESIATRGVIQPIIVRPLEKGRYQLVAGERRWRAAQRARLHHIPALVRKLDQREVLALALIENIQREDLNPIEEARAYSRLSDDEEMTQAEIAKLVDKSRSHVANLMRLLSLPDTVLDQVESGALSMGHARALVGRTDADVLAKKAVSEGLSVRAMERLARGGSAPKTPKSSAPSNGAAPDADILAVQHHLEEFLGMPVQIKPEADPKSGQVTIRYRTLDQLDLVCQRLTGGEI